MDEEYITGRTKAYAKKNPKSSRVEKGQFFTDPAAARYMAMQFDFDKDSVSLLDMGFGSGILSSAVVERAMACGVKEIRLVAAENDENIFPVMKDIVRKMRAGCKSSGVSFYFRHIKEDYLAFEDNGRYDAVISNPPYLKIGKNSKDALVMSRYVYGQPNLYALFMAKGLEQLKDGGQYVYITPRSWTSGAYYQKVREYIESASSIRSILLFNDRSESFSSDGILQETMILSGVKSETQGARILVRHTDDYTLSDLYETDVAAGAVIEARNPHRIFIPSGEAEQRALEHLSAIDTTLSDFGFIFKTGPVVEYRNQAYVSPKEKKGYVPMVRGINITSDGRFCFPADTEKNQYADESRKKFLIPDRPTVFVRRLSAKESAHRIMCCAYTGKGHGNIAVENHVNYLAKKDGTPVSKKEAIRIQNLLSSDEYDAYFRTFGGSTQVNAADLNLLPVERGLL